MDFFFLILSSFFKEKSMRTGKRVGIESKTIQVWYFPNKHKEPKNNFISYCSFWNFTWVFFQCLREREGFRVGWFKRECYSEKLRESVTARNWERERVWFRERKSRDQVVRERGLLDLGLKRITTTVGGSGHWWSELRSFGDHGGLVSRAMWDQERERN